MRARWVGFVVASGLVCGCAAGRPSSSAPTVPAPVPRAAHETAPVDPSLVEVALLAEGDARTTAVEQLRREGPAALVAVLDARAADDPSGSDERWATLVDEVAQQRDASYGGLFWYTDLSQAKARARATGQPILSLRLLGKLTDEYSCANSRFFRTALYSNPELAAWMRDRFVLHWSAERPVPTVTIDYGDGRTLRRTVTGNSAHYVLDGQARPIDVLPGLYGPKTFREQLEVSLALHGHLASHPDEREALLADHHAARIDEGADALWHALRGLDTRRPTRRRLRASMLAASWRDPASFPTAADAAPAAPTKATTERPILRHAIRSRMPARQGGFVLTPAGWAALGEHHRELGRLHSDSVALIGGERSDLLGDTASFERLLAAFEVSVAADTLFNEYALRVRVHDWFARGEAGPTFDALNARVYDELFLTPADDRWLGLLQPEVYTGLEGNGVVPSAQPPVAAR